MLEPVQFLAPYDGRVRTRQKMKSTALVDVEFRQASPDTDDLLDILRLQQRNLFHLVPQEDRTQGFLSFATSRDLLQASAARIGITIAHAHDEVVAYLLPFTIHQAQRVPALVPVAERFSAHDDRQTTFEQLCVRRTSLCRQKISRVWSIQASV